MMMGLRAAGRGSGQSGDADAAAKEEWAYSAGLQIWLFGLALMKFEQFRRLMNKLEAPAENLPYAPINQIGHMRQLPTSDSMMPFTPNVDTLYSGSILELKDRPMVFTAPAMPDRYWSLELADAFLANLPYLGTRVTGREAGAWLIVGPHWEGEVPDGLTLYRCPTNSVMIALRVRIEGPWDTEAVVTLQHGFRLTTLENYLGGTMKPAPRYDAGEPDGATHDLAFFTTLCRLLADNPPYERDRPIVEMMKVLGLTPGAVIDPDSIDPDFRRGLVRASETGPSVIGWRVKYRGTKSPTYWGVDLRGGSYGTDYLSRAEGAVQGLFVHDAEECEYFHAYHDGSGQLLNGSNTYRIHFAADQIPPVHPFGFWSITAYTPMYMLIPNEHHRYSVQSSDRDLVLNPDGSLDIAVGPAAPAENLANWIATTPGELFRLNMRVYLPQDPMLDEKTVLHFLPPIERTNA